MRRVAGRLGRKCRLADVSPGHGPSARVQWALRRLQYSNLEGGSDMRRREFLRTFTAGAAMPMMARAAVAWQNEASARFRDYRWVETNSPRATSRTDDIW